MFICLLSNNVNSLDCWFILQHSDLNSEIVVYFVSSEKEISLCVVKILSVTNLLNPNNFHAVS